MKESVFVREGVSVSCRLRRPTDDRRHLIVVFAGVAKGQHDFYGFDGRALDLVKGAILWIKESFERVMHITCVKEWTSALSVRFLALSTALHSYTRVTSLISAVQGMAGQRQWC